VTESVKTTPAKIGRYEIGRELGRGAMGVVYEAHDPALGRTIALKTIHPAIAGKEDREAFEARFFTEARVAARLQHPGIVVVHDVGRDGDTGTLYIALEHLKGRTLAELTDGGRSLAWREAARILAAAARALHHAHGHGIVHRDMKPANVMVLDSGEVKLMDFGIAKIEASLHGLTTPGEFLGTPLYMAPEQAHGGAITPRTDIFSLGAIGYTLLTGRPAFQGETVARIVLRVVGEDPGSPSLVTPGIPDALDGIIARAIAKDPAARYGDALALAEDLEALLEDRSPQHLTGDGTARPHLPPGLELVVAEDDPPSAGARPASEEPPPTRTIAPAGMARASSPRSPVARSWRATLTRRLLLVGLGVVGGVAVTHLFVNRPEPLGMAGASSASDLSSLAPPARSLEAPSTSVTLAPAAPNAAITPSLLDPAPLPLPDPGRLAIDFEHPLKAGLLRIWLDEELVVEQRLVGQPEKKALVFSVRRGSFRDVLEVTPGRHTLRVQVAWEDSAKSEAISGTFRSGATRRLQVRLGRLRKNLSLEWE
jgi:serine/threonine-protein kinase